MNSTLGRETTPKHGGRGAIYVPEPAVQVIERLPPRLQDDLFFHTKTCRQFRQESWWRTWDPIRTQFARELPAGHHLRQRLAQDPDDKLDFHELRHMGASYALNVLEIEPWVIAKQLRHSTMAPPSSSSMATPRDEPPWTACGADGTATCDRFRVGGLRRRAPEFDEQS